MVSVRQRGPRLPKKPQVRRQNRRDPNELRSTNQQSYWYGCKLAAFAPVLRCPSSYEPARPVAGEELGRKIGHRPSAEPATPAVDDLRMRLYRPEVPRLVEWSPVRSSPSARLQLTSFAVIPTRPNAIMTAWQCGDG